MFQMVKHIAFGIAAFIPLVFSFQKSSHTPLLHMHNSHTLPLQATWYYVRAGNNNKLPPESTFLL